MPIVTLTTDWGTSDFYVAAFKGHILSLCPQACIVDISHDTSHLENITQGAYKLRNAYPFFPESSIHVVGVSSEAYPNEPFIAAESNGHFFICKNNGFLSLALDDFGSATAIAQPEKLLAGFSILHVVPPAIQKLLQGVPVSSLGEAIAPKTFTLPQPIIRHRRAEQGAKPCVETIIGHIVHVDSNGNVITNITRTLFYGNAQNRPYTIFVSSNRYSIAQVSNTYADVKDGTLVAFFNSQGLLEIATSNGNSSHLYKYGNDSTVTIVFK
jgi:S-adenosylmethionine hydrolase